MRIDFLAMNGKKRRKIRCTVAYKTIEATKLYVRLEQGTFGTGSERHTTYLACHIAFMWK